MQSTMINSAENRPLFTDLAFMSRIERATKSIPAPVQWRLLTLALVLNDLLMTGLAFRVAYFLRFDLSFPFFRHDAIPSLLFYRRLVLVLIPVWLLIFVLIGLYSRRNLLGGTQEYSKAFHATTIGMFAVIAAGFLLPEFIFARGWLLMAWGFAFFFVALGRFFLRRAVYFARGQGYFISNAVIIGGNNEGFSLAEQLQSWKTSGLHLVGFVDEIVPAGTRLFRNLYSLGTVDQLDKIIADYNVEELILATSAISSRDNVTDIFRRFGSCPNLHVRLSSGLYEIITTGLRVKEFAFVPLVEVNQVRLTGIDQALKLVLDYSLTIPVTILAFPVMLLIGLAIKLDSPGPVIYRRRVMGVNGRMFDAFKFRTMAVNGDEILEANPVLKAELAQNHKLKEDPRITRVGKLLRQTSLDELPQLFNVLRGEMSLVGPRMITQPEMEKYSRWDMNLLTMRPGITGLWQVSGRSDVSYDERVRMDMYYIRNWSIWLDIQLVLQTFPAVIKRRGAY
jgi:exopolysaccharide biosynthesis polyprenyl glycosylphosphotransferase